MSPWPLVVMALALASRKRSRGRGRGGTVKLLPGVVRGPRDVQQKLYRLANRTGINFTVTSWVRTYRAQAAAMLAKVDRGDDLLELYRDKEQVRALLRSPHTIDEWARVLEAWDEDGRGISRHLGGRGTDLRTRNLTDAQVRALMREARAMGGNPVLEPDHLHIGW